MIADIVVMSVTFASVSATLAALGFFLRDLFATSEPPRQRLELAAQEPTGELNRAFFQLVEASGTSLDMTTALLIVLGGVIAGGGICFVFVENLLAVAGGIILGGALPLAWLIVVRAIRVGQMRKVLVNFDRNGFSYVLDRKTGELLQANPFVTVNWATGVDLKTGKPIEDPAKRTSSKQNTKDICPSAMGGKNQQPVSFSPRTGFFYVPTNNLCMDYEGVEVKYQAGQPYVGAIVVSKPGPGGNRGEFIAWDPSAGKKVWGIPDKFLVYSGVLATAGDLVFYGTVEGFFRAVNARTGQVLWQEKLGSGIIGAPMTYLGPDGKQYVAILAGVGGAARVSADLDGYPPEGGTLYVFGIPPLPEATVPTLPDSGDLR